MLFLWISGWFKNRISKLTGYTTDIPFLFVIIWTTAFYSRRLFALKHTAFYSVGYPAFPLGQSSTIPAFTKRNLIWRVNIVNQTQIHILSRIHIKENQIWNTDSLILIILFLLLSSIVCTGACWAVPAAGRAGAGAIHQPQDGVCLLIIGRGG